MISKKYKLRFANKKDIPSLYLFDKRIAKTTTIDFYPLHSKENFERKLKIGKLLLLLDKDKIISWCGYLFPVKKDFEKYNISKKEGLKSAFLFGTAVDVKYRGQGIQDFFIKKRIEILKKKGCKKILITVNPKNIFSKRNILKNNFKFVKRKKEKENYLCFYFLEV
ncbi:MAG: GNAT family N-acetyltransferase [Bacilli bacterium]|nr:GNAT family N-acetyltransferase [Bacilli bacterium]